MLPLHAAAIFLGAFLLFLVQPIAARMVLPVLGGSPSVWNTCMVFFQGALLAGYAYAHGLMRLRGRWAAVGVHGLVVLAAALTLPLSMRHGWVGAIAQPIPWLLGTLVLGVGPAFFALAATGPLVQGWFARTRHAAAGDPYFLYAASNAGSMIALLAYPFVVEPLVTLRGQSGGWSVGYLVFAGVIIACGAAASRGGPGPAEERAEAAPVPGIARARWVLLAFIPSSLMLGVTQYISTDLAPVPLLWVVPLALYLLSFILVFGRRRVVPPWAWSGALTILVIALSVAFLRGAREPASLLIVLHLAALFAGSMVCHGRLAAERPPAGRLTEYYLLIAAGGVLGGVFNAIVAPLVFTSLVEYPIALALACLFRVGRSPRPGPTVRGVLLDAGLAVGLVIVYLSLEVIAALVRPGQLGPGLELLVTIALPVGVPVFIMYLFSRSNSRFALGVGGVLVLAQMSGAWAGLDVRILHAERTFFGTLRVESQDVIVLGEDGPRVETFHGLFHGTTQHGLQNMAPSKRAVPLVYYHPEGPIGQVMGALRGDARLERIGLVGLGSGAMAAYGGQGQALVFFEIDPAVVRIATTPQFFSYIADCQARGGVVEFREGDGRLALGREEGKFGVLVLDAFSSDAIPIHLLTVEAIRVYLDRLAPGGLLAFHISNRHLELEPVLAAAAEVLKLRGLIRADLATEEQMLEGRSSSTWAVLAREPGDLAFLSRDARWRGLQGREGFRPWTDDFSNIWTIFR